MLVDTHSHIYAAEFDADRAQMMERAKANGVSLVLMPNIDSRSIDAMHQVEKDFPNCRSMMGLHPTSVKEDMEQELKIIESHLFSRPYYGVGEIGIDLYWDKTFKDRQMEAFRVQLQWAQKLSLPVVIHCREAFPEVFGVVDLVHDSRLRGVFHSFGGGVDELKRIAEYKTFKIGINGIVTFKKNILPEVLLHADSSLVLAETDAPYLAPHPHRGTRNEPGYVKLVVQKLAQVYDMPFDEMVRVLGQNTKAIFNV
ncbi:MAG: TatD family hydrolase [Breznakibacter sp.]